MKKSVCIIFISVLLCGTVAASSIHYNKNTVLFDELDQSQTEIGTTILWIGRHDPINRQGAQSYIPQKGILTRVELYISRWEVAPANEPFYLAVRETLTGDTLTEISISPSSVPVYDFAWKTFDFPDIPVDVGETYYIVGYSNETSQAGLYLWGAIGSNPYANGMVFFLKEDSPNWKQSASVDTGFKTYGIDNDPPNKPSITGTTEGSPGVSYDYTFSAVEPDGENVKFLIDWDDGNQEETDYIASGDTITVNHSWASKGFYSIKAKAIDVLDKESEWETLNIRMPKNQQTSNMWFLRWLERLPILQRLWELYGTK